MQKIPDPFIETVRSHTDLITVVSKHLTLKKSGRNFMGLCPFHAEKTPSFVVNPEKQFFHCFGCSAGGDVFHFLSKIEQITFPEAVRRLASAAGLTIPTIRKETTDTSEAGILYRIHEEAERFFHECLLHRSEAVLARDYLKERGISEETIQTFRIGFAAPYREHFKRLGFPPALLEKAGLVRRGENGAYDTFRNRILFPIKTVEGRTVGFGGRALDNKPPKYLNTPETPIFTKGKLLYGLEKVRGQTSVILVEGYFDAITLHQHGISNAVATLGTALTPDHLHHIRRSIENLYVVFDPDAAGQAALYRSAPLFIERGLATQVITLPAGEDPDLFIRREGRAAFLKQMQDAPSLIDFSIRYAVNRFPSSLEGRTKALHELFLLVQKMNARVEQGDALKKIAESLGMDEKDVRADFNGFKAKRGGLPRPVAHARTPECPTGNPVSDPLSHIPEDEKTVMALVIQERLTLEELGDIRPADFTTPALKNLVSLFWKGATESWSRPQDLLNILSDSDRPLFTGLAVLDLPSENQEKMKADCVRSLQMKRLQREIRKVQNALKTAERDRDPHQTGVLQQTFFNLKKELQNCILKESRRG